MFATDSPPGLPGDGNLLQRAERLEAEVASVMGVINASYGRLVELVGVALDQSLWTGTGIHSPAHWLGWQAGLSQGLARSVVSIAERRGELPSAVGALREGTITIDAVAEIAKRAPASHEASITALAKDATVTQLRNTLRDYDYGDRAKDDPRKRKPELIEEERSVSMGTDEQGWWLKGRLPADEGAAVEAAIHAARDDIYRKLVQGLDPDGLGPDARNPTVNLADGLLAAAELSLRAGEAAHPGSDRYLVHAHLQARPCGEPTPDRWTGPGGPGRWCRSGQADPTPTAAGPGTLALHQGMALPEALRRLLLCDASCVPVLERDGIPLNVGRRTRVISRRLRRLIEHRDRCCRTPGCGQRHGLEIHHIVHWEDGGPTETANLVALCRRHHRTHHLGRLGISGNADHPAGTPGALSFTDEWDRPMPGSGSPVPPEGTPSAAAARLGIHPGRYRHPLGERLDRRFVHLSPNPAGSRQHGQPVGPEPPPTG